MNKLPVSPKLSLGLVLAVLASSIMANLATVSPAMLHLGPWSPFIYGTTGAIVAFVAGYYKTDPLMSAGAAAQAANDAAAAADMTDPYTAPALPATALPATAALPLTAAALTTPPAPAAPAPAAAVPGTPA